MTEYTVYSLPNCKHCVAAKLELTTRSIPFTEVDIKVFGKEELQKKMIQAGSNVQLKTAPQIFKGEDYIGGSTELSKHLSA